MGLRVLAVDDDDDARELLAAVLTQQSAHVVEAGSATRALALFRRERPDVMISDIGMPAADGYWLIGRVRAMAEAEGGRTPAFALTAYAGGADRARAIDAGFDAHFAKPVDIDALIDALVEVRSRLAR